MSDPPECERCGQALVDDRDKNAAGWWRDRCMDCLEDLAYSPGDADE